MSTRGPNVFAISRDAWDDPDLPDAPFSPREAWFWLIGAAAWKDLRTRGSTGAPVGLRRGEFSFSVRFLATKWKWSKSAVDRFLTKFEKRDIIRDASRDGNKVYSIRNYNKFQVVGAPKRDRVRDDAGDASGTAAGHGRDKEETGVTGITGELSDRPKKTLPLSDPQSGSDVGEVEKSEKGKASVPRLPRTEDGFERFWRAAEPAKFASKAKAREAWAKTRGLRPPDDVLIAAHAAYRASVAAENARRKREHPPRTALSLCHPVTFLAERRWEGFLDSATAKPAPVPPPPEWGAQGKALAAELGPAVFATWFAGAKLDAGPPVAIVVEKRFKRRWIEDHFREALERVFGDSVRIVCPAEIEAVAA